MATHTNGNGIATKEPRFTVDDIPATTKRSSKSEVVEVIERFKIVKFKCRVIGTTPFIFNRMSAKLELLHPRQKKNRGERAASLKHDPIAEFRRTFDTSSTGPTLLVVPGAMLKGAIRSAALDTVGTSKAEIGRLVQVEDSWIHMYGIPHMYMATVRSADMNRTPDIRTRALMPKWCCEFTVSFASPRINLCSVMSLVFNAGITVGIGDYRTEKGRGNYGGFQMVTEQIDEDGHESKAVGDAGLEREWKEIIASGGRASQVKAVKDAAPYDESTRELFGQYMDALKADGKIALLKS